MAGSPDTGSLLALAEAAEALGYDSVWVGDSLLARPRHEPLTLLAGVAARTRRVALGTAVLLPALRNPVLLAHQVATLDRLAEGPGWSSASGSRRTSKASVTSSRRRAFPSRSGVVAWSRVFACAGHSGPASRWNGRAAGG